MPNPARPPHAGAVTAPVDPRLDELLRGAVVLGAALVLLLPAARGFHATLGWLPLWLLGMPLAAWWALHRFRLPRRAVDAASPRAAARPARRAPQARRRARPRPAAGYAQAA